MTLKKTKISEDSAVSNQLTTEWKEDNEADMFENAY